MVGVALSSIVVLSHSLPQSLPPIASGLMVSIVELDPGTVKKDPWVVALSKDWPIGSVFCLLLM